MDKYERNMREVAKAMKAIEKNTAEIAKELKKMNHENRVVNVSVGGKDLKNFSERIEKNDFS